MVAFTVANYIGNAFAPTLVDDAPLVLLLLSPKLRWLFLISHQLDAVTYYVVPLLRATVLLGVYYLLGAWFGDRALRWLEQRAGNALRPVLWIERTFHRARYPVTFLFPGTVAAMLAGAGRMRVVGFFGVALASIALRLWAVRVLAESLRGPVLTIVEWIGDNQVWLTAVSVATVLAWVGWANRRGLPQAETIEQIEADFAPEATDGSEPV
jgi:hypothetical protein